MHMYLCPSYFSLLAVTFSPLFVFHFLESAVTLWNLRVNNKNNYKNDHSLTTFFLQFPEPTPSILFLKMQFVI